MDMASLLGTTLVTVLNYKRGPMSAIKRPLKSLILAAAHIAFNEICEKLQWLRAKVCVC